jgi:hypothetical protein
MSRDTWTGSGPFSFLAIASCAVFAARRRLLLLSKNNSNEIGNQRQGEFATSADDQQEEIERPKPADGQQEEIGEGETDVCLYGNHFQVVGQRIERPTPVDGQQEAICKAGRTNIADI